MLRSSGCAASGQAIPPQALASDWEKQPPPSRNAAARGAAGWRGRGQAFRSQGEAAWGSIQAQSCACSKRCCAKEGMPGCQRPRWRTMKPTFSKRSIRAAQASDANGKVDSSAGPLIPFGPAVSRASATCSAAARELHPSHWAPMDAAVARRLLPEVEVVRQLQEQHPASGVHPSGIEGLAAPQHPGEGIVEDVAAPGPHI